MASDRCFGVFCMDLLYRVFKSWFLGPEGFFLLIRYNVKLGITTFVPNSVQKLQAVYLFPQILKTDFQRDRWKSVFACAPGGARF